MGHLQILNIIKLIYNWVSIICCTFQDHLELFNGAVRSSLGANNNPTSKQFESIFKRLLVKLEIRDVQGNATKQDETALLVISSAPKRKEPKFDVQAISNISRFDELEELENILNDSSLVRNLI